jgi:MFS superfamily sulfate permease-like transporter
MSENPETPSLEEVHDEKGSHWKEDAISGFLVFLIALPLCLGISMASGFPPIAGVLSAIVGGVMVTFIGSARLTIKGPAAGLIVIALGAVGELGQGDPVMGYKRALAVGMGAAALQIIFALVRAGTLGDLMPLSVVHGMLAAIGVIIVSKQVHVALGVVPHAKEPLELLMEIPHSLSHANPGIMLIGVMSLVLLFGWPMVSKRWSRIIPAPLLVLLASVPVGIYLHLDTVHEWVFRGHSYNMGPEYLVQLPGSLMQAVTHPDFSVFFTMTSFKYVVMFALVGTIESLLSVSAVDAMDPEKHASDLDKDLLATGIGNLISAAIGGLPMISEIVRSKANIDNGAKSEWANFFHGLCLLVFVAAVPGLLQKIPLAALAAMLVYTGLRLAAPSEFLHALEVGRDQLFLFLVTFLVTLASDLLIGVAAGLLLKAAMHLVRGIPFRSLFSAPISTDREGNEVHIHVQDAAIFTNFLGLKRELKAIDEGVERVVVDLRGARVVDHTVLSKLESIGNEWPDKELVVAGLEEHQAQSIHPQSARCLPRGS